MSSRVKPATDSLKATLTSKVPAAKPVTSELTVTDGPVGASGSIMQVAYS